MILVFVNFFNLERPRSVDSTQRIAHKRALNKNSPEVSSIC